MKKMSVYQKYYTLLDHLFRRGFDWESLRRDLTIKKGRFKIDFASEMRKLISEYKSVDVYEHLGFATIAVAKNHICYTTCTGRSITINTKNGRHTYYAPAESRYFRSVIKSVFPGIRLEKKGEYDHLKWYIIPRNFIED